MLRHLWRSLHVETEKAVEPEKHRTLTLDDLKTGVHPLFPNCACYPYVGKKNWAKLLSQFSSEDRKNAQRKLQTIADFYPRVPHLSPADLKILQDSPAQFWSQTWRGAPNQTPYCPDADTKWAAIGEGRTAPQNFQYLASLPIFLPNPGDTANQERYYLGRYDYWMKFLGAHTGLVVLNQLPFIATSLQKDLQTGEIFALVARPVVMGPLSNQLLVSGMLKRKGTV